MRAVIQRVDSASVYVDGKIVGECGAGFLVLLCVMENDTEAESDLLCRKIANLRIFEDDAGKINRSLSDVGGQLLVISQFTLAANCVHGNRPDFLAAAKPEKASAMFDSFIEKIKKTVPHTQTGVFGAHMDVKINNNGPFTVILDTDQLMKTKEKST